MATYDVKQIALPGGDIANLKDGNAIHKSNTSGFVKNDGSIDQNTYQIAQEGKGLSTNDFTNEDKALIGQTLGNNTVLTTDKTPFLTRQTLNPTGFSGYVREKLIGASYAWNQLVQNGNFADGTSGWNTYQSTISVTSGVCTMVRTVASGSSSVYRTVSKVPNRKYFWKLTAKNNTGSNSVMVQWCKVGSGGTVMTLMSNTGLSNNYTTYMGIISTDSADADGALIIFHTGSINNSIDIKDIEIIDLTLAFGSTIADYLYSLTNNGGITKLRDMGCPIDKYTAYGNYLVSSKTSGKKIVGFNLWDEEWEVGTLNGSTGESVSFSNRIRSKNFNRCFGGIDYYVRIGFNVALRVAWYDANYGFISAPTTGTSNIMTSPSNACYFKVTTEGTTYGETYRNDICVNISDTNKNGQYEPYCGYEIPLGNDELRGKFDLVDGEIVASGDVKESNGNIGRNYNIVDLGIKDWSYHASTSSTDTSRFSLADGSQYLPDAEVPNPNNVANVVCARYVASSNTQNVNGGSTRTGYISVTTGGNIVITDTRYTTATDLKTALNGVYLIYKKASVTTEQSTPFADPMSMVGATTEEYIDNRDIPCPVGAERQYMGQSEDVVEIPSSPLSDGKRKLVAETSGGKTQYYFEDDKNGAGTQVNLMTYNTSTNKYVCPSDGYISLSNAGASVGDYIIMSVYGANDNLICGLRCDTSVASIVTVQNLFVKRGMKCYVRATSSTGSFTALFTPLA